MHRPEPRIHPMLAGSNTALSVIDGKLTNEDFARFRETYDRRALGQLLECCLTHTQPTPDTAPVFTPALERAANG